MKVFVGIDGGGTKTEALAVDETGQLVGKAKAEGMNPNTMKEWEGTLHRIHRQLNLPENVRTQVFAGVSGAGTEIAREKIISTCEEIFRGRVEVDTDAVNALYSGVHADPGIVQICGTGSITYGVNGRGVRKRVGGWGYLFGDRGSGYEIGRRAVLACLESEDNLAFPTVLSRYIHNWFEEENGRDILQKIYESSSPKSLVSPVCELVMKAAGKEDEVARNILYEETIAITSHILRVQKELFLEEKAPVVLIGGVLNNPNPFRSMIIEQLEKKGMKVILPVLSPVEGALFGAIKEESDIIKENVSMSIGGSPWPQLPED